MFCNNCPRKCNADRSAGPEGWCCLDDGIHIASICLHHGEEPPLSGSRGIVNVFFEHCNMQCIYCQNYDISCNDFPQSKGQPVEEVCDRIEKLLPLSEGNLGFVSPSHCVPQVVAIVNTLRQRGLNPIIVFNSNGYDLAETIRSLEGIVDVWLPDFKYSDDKLAMEYSAAPDYSTIALSSLKEIVHQCGVTLQTNERGIAVRGVIVRHLVLPGASANSIGVLRMIAEEVSPNLHISLMSQYYPAGKVAVSGERKVESVKRREVMTEQNLEPSTLNSEPLLRTVTKSEYETVIEAFHSLGFSRGWLQEYDSHINYRPDFSKDNPFIT
jgi:putative pyruvate formate lyase activating enzyme